MLFGIGFIVVAMAVFAFAVRRLTLISRHAKSFIEKAESLQPNIDLISASAYETLPQYAFDALAEAEAGRDSFLTAEQFDALTADQQEAFLIAQEVQTLHYQATRMSNHKRYIWGQVFSLKPIGVPE